MNKVIVYSDNYFSQVCLEFLVEKICAMGSKPYSFSIFCFESASLDCETLRAMLLCDPQKMMVIAKPDLIDFLVVNKMVAIEYSCSYESNIETILVALKRFLALGCPRSIPNRYCTRKIKITPYERTIMNMLISGISIESISNELGKTSKTISTYKRNFMKKTGVKSNIALINKWEMILRMEDIKSSISSLR